MKNLGSEAKTIIAKCYVENGGKDLSSLPDWISPSDAQEYMQRLQKDSSELDTILMQDFVSHMPPRFMSGAIVIDDEGK